MIRATCICDGSGCEAVRKEANHWWMVTEIDDEPGKSPYLEIRPWDPKEADSPSTKHYCGETCLQKRVSQFCSK